MSVSLGSDQNKNPTKSQPACRLSGLIKYKLHGEKEDGSERICVERFVNRIIRQDFALMDEEAPIWFYAIAPLRIKRLFLLNVELIQEYLESKELYGGRQVVQRKLELIGHSNIIPMPLASFTSNCFVLFSGNLN